MCRQNNGEKTMVKNWWKADCAAMKDELNNTDWSGLEQMTASEAWQVPIHGSHK
jgi:hypothetical protein